MATNVLILGGGGREHALAWKLGQSASAAKVWCAPGNGGITEVAECVGVNLSDPVAVGDLAEKVKIDLTVVGPEQPLASGVADEFVRRGLAIVGPQESGARLEASKVFAKEFLERRHIPTAAVYAICDSPGDVYSALCAVDWPVVMKADGPCAGKGVLVTSSPDEATDFTARLMEKRVFGDSGSPILLEEGLVGRELSYIVLTDGTSFVPLAPTRDHKRALDGDEGPNTGGMGAISGNELLPADLDRTIRETIVVPTIKGLAAEGIPYRGFLYFGLMLTADGPKVLEFNCRLGDPEAQAILVRLESDLLEVLKRCSAGDLAGVNLRWKPGASACVVLASKGYPGTFESGKRIDGLGKVQGGTVVFHAGTDLQGGTYYTRGGRVLGVTATGSSLRSAIDLAYEGVSAIHFEGMHYRRDIGREPASSAATNG